jgi:hypothetical protein
MLAAMFIIFNAEVIQPGHMKVLDEAMVISGALFTLFQEQTNRLTERFTH